MRTIELTELPRLVGEELGVSDWIEITQARVNSFAEATGDFQWIHVDVERAARETGGAIAHGYLVLSLIPLLTNELMTVRGVARSLNYGSDRVRFVSPVRVGKRLRMRRRLLTAEVKAGGLLVKFENILEVEGESKPACLAETIGLYFPEETAAAE